VIGVTENLPKIRDLLAKAAVDAGRDTNTVRLLAVSKKQPQSRVVEAAAAGQLDFGENQVAEGVGLKIAARLSQQRPDSLGDLNICLQINVDEEESKSGIPANAVRDLAWQVLDLPKLRLRGLMCLPAIRHDFDAQRVPFARLSSLADQLRADGIPTDTLSMGMSGDYRAAIFEGSTMVRIGTAIFGPRGKA